VHNWKSKIMLLYNKIFLRFRFCPSCTPTRRVWSGTVMHWRVRQILPNFWTRCPRVNTSWSRWTLSRYLVNLKHSFFELHHWYRFIWISYIGSLYVLDTVTQGQNTMLLNCAGNVKYQGKMRCFTQTFIITNIGGVWY